MVCLLSDKLKLGVCDEQARVETQNAEQLATISKADVMSVCIAV